MSLFNPTAQILLNREAWVETAANGGNDATAQLGNPAKPFATAQAAIDALFALGAVGAAGVGALHFGMGVHAAATLNEGFSNWNLAISGTGQATCTFNGFVFHRSSATPGGMQIEVQDIGNQSVLIAGLELGRSGAEGDVEGFGNSGGEGPAFIGRGLKVSGQLNVTGGYGAGGSAGTGGSGGPGGSITLYDSDVFQGISNGGSGGSSENGGFNGGNGGAGGQITLHRSRMTYATVVGAAGGAGSEGGGAGVDGNGGLVTSRWSELGDANLLSNGAGAIGSYDGQFSILSTYSGGATTDVRFVTFNGTAYETGPLP